MNKTPVRITSNIIGFTIGSLILVVTIGIRMVGVDEFSDRYMSLLGVSKVVFLFFILFAVAELVLLITLILKRAGSDYSKEDLIYAGKCILITAILTIVLIPGMAYLAVTFL